MSFLTDDRAYLRPIVIIAIQTGLRKGELLSLKRTQVDFVRELIHVTNTKSGRDKFVPMNVVVRSELRKAAEASSGFGIPLLIRLGTRRQNCDKNEKKPEPLRLASA